MDELMIKPRGYNEIQVTVQGRVFDERTKKFLEPELKHKQLSVTVKRHGSYAKVVGVHELVGLAYIPNPTQHKYIRFIDGDRTNVHVRNLYWAEEPADDMATVHLPEYSDFYKLVRDGRIWSERLMAFMSPSPGSKDYPSVWLFGHKGKNSWQQLHRLIAFAFVHNPDPDHLTVCHHIDNNSRNAAANNLRWVSTATNVKEGWNAGRFRPKGANHCKFKGYYVFEGVVTETVAEMASHLGVTPGRVAAMMRHEQVQLIPKDRVPHGTDVKKQILDSMNKRRLSRSKKK
jgi:hypothetical protein